MALYKFNSTNFEKVDSTTFSNERIWERTHIQNALKNQISVIASDLLVISEEFSEWNDSKRRIDLLAVDKDANIVVIELKRTETGEHMELQALRYASMVSTLTFKRTIEIFDKYLKSTSSPLDAEEELLNFFGWSEEEDSFASDVKIILVSSDFSKELTTTVMWLNERDLDIKCFRLIPYKYNNDVLIDAQQIIPLPEAETYQIKIREQKEERKEARKSTKDYSTYQFNGSGGLNKRNLVKFVWKQYLKDKAPISFEQVLNDFPKDLRNNLFSTYEQAIEKQKNDANHLIRYFIDDDMILNIGDTKYVISNQWGKSRIESFIDHVIKLVYVITKDE